MKKIFTVMLGMMLMFSLVSLVSAEETIVPESSNFFTILKYKLTQFGLFTAAGQSRECSTEADSTITIPAGTTSKATLGSVCSGSFLIDLFTPEWSFLDEYESEIIGDGLSTSSPKIVEIYCCPYSPCESNQDCIDMGEGTTCQTSYGSCSGSVPSHETKKYNCVNENWQASGYSDYGEDRFCLDEDDNNYLDKNGGEHCRESSYSSVNNNVWCGEDEVEDECVEGKEKCISGNDDCIGENYFLCENEEWIDKGEVDGECGVGDEEINEEGTSDGILRDDMKTSTSSRLSQSLCTQNSDCITGSCLSVGSLISDGDLLESQAKATLGDFCDEGSIITLIEILGSKIGLGEGVCGLFLDDFNDFKSTYGYCIIDVKDEGGFESLEVLAETLAFFDIDGSGSKNSTDGYIIGGILIFFTMLVILKK